jgi:hypothetical protein
VELEGFFHCSAAHLLHCSVFAEQKRRGGGKYASIIGKYQWQGRLQHNCRSVLGITNINSLLLVITGCDSSPMIGGHSGDHQTIASSRHVGLEPTENSRISAANQITAVGAPKASPTLWPPVVADDDLSELNDAWSALSPAMRAGIMAMVRAAAIVK